MITISIETSADYWGVENLLDHSFAPGREALSSYRLREGVSAIAGLCMVAKNEFDAIVGAIRYWPILIGVSEKPELLLGPIAVHPTVQGEGLGGKLMKATLSKAQEMGFDWVLLVGDLPYYQRFGFAVADGISFPPPTNPNRILIKNLSNRRDISPTGVVKSVKSVA